MTSREDKKSREARLAEALRANLLRRKAQARAQSPAKPPEKPDSEGKDTPPR